MNLPKNAKSEKKILLVCLALFLALGTFAGSSVWSRYQRMYYPTFAQVLNVQLPVSASEVWSLREPGWDGGEYWVSAKMSEQDFKVLMQSLKMARMTESQLDNYLGCMAPRPALKQWTTTGADANTYLVECDAYIVAKYENGHMFLRRSFN